MSVGQWLGMKTAVCVCLCVPWEQCVGPDEVLSEAGFVHHVQVHLII